MKALLHDGPGKLVLRDVPIPEIGDGEALLKVEACGVSASDLDEPQDGGLDPRPSVGGAVAGRIERIGPGASRFKRGDRVFASPHVPCLECHYCRRGSLPMCREFRRTRFDPAGAAQFVRLSDRHVEHAALRLPPKLAFNHAAMIEPLARCLRNAGRLGLEPGDFALVMGLGALGLMTCQDLLRRDIGVLALDGDHTRVRFAQKLGVEHAYTGKDGRTGKVILSLTHNRGADAMIITEPVRSLGPERLAWVRDGGVLDFFGEPASRQETTLALGELRRRELTLIAGSSPAPEDLRAACGLVASGEIDVSLYAKHTFPLERFEEALRRLRGREIVEAVLLPQHGVSRSRK